MFLKSPNLPKEKVGSVLIDYRAEHAFKNLQELGINVYKTPELNIAYPAVAGHPDMLFHILDSKNAIVAPEVFSYFKNLFGETIVLGFSKIGNTYPHDVAYNIARIGNFAFHNVKYTDTTINEYYKQNGVKLINVKQGYSKCSICIVSENAFITADKKIAETAQKHEIDVLLIREGYVKLKGFSHGFIGGASGLISGEMLVFNGDISKHPDYKSINNFCAKHGVEVVSLNKNDLEDIGSIIPLF